MRTRLKQMLKKQIKIEKVKELERETNKDRYRDGLGEEESVCV